MTVRCSASAIRARRRGSEENCTSSSSDVACKVAWVVSSLGVEIQVVRPAESLGERDNAGGSEHDGSNNVHDHFDVRIDLRDEWIVDGLGVESSKVVRARS